MMYCLVACVGVGDVTAIGQSITRGQWTRPACWSAPSSEWWRTSQVCTNIFRLVTSCLLGCVCVCVCVCAHVPAWKLVCFDYVLILYFLLWNGGVIQFWETAHKRICYYCYYLMLAQLCTWRGGGGQHGSINLNESLETHNTWQQEEHLNVYSDLIQA